VSPVLVFRSFPTKEILSMSRHSLQAALVACALSATVPHSPTETQWWHPMGRAPPAKPNRPPNNATTTPVLALYEEAFTNNSQGYASALAWILFLIIFGFTFFQFRQQRDEATSGGVS